MKGLKGDLILLALMLSAAVHVGLMFYARPKVMVTVAGSSALAHRRGPMRVSEAAPPPDILNVEVVKDVDAAKDAPEAAETVTSSPGAGARA